MLSIEAVQDGGQQDAPERTQPGHHTQGRYREKDDRDHAEGEDETPSPLSRDAVDPNAGVMLHD
jgi:hypothetical protein